MQCSGCIHQQNHTSPDAVRMAAMGFTGCQLLPAWIFVAQGAQETPECFVPAQTGAQSPGNASPGKKAA
jgi:hypothetical protein